MHILAPNWCARSACDGTPVVASHSFNVLPKLPLRMVLPSAGLKQQARTHPVWQVKVRMHAPVATDQSMSVLSEPPERVKPPPAALRRTLRAWRRIGPANTRRW